MTIKREEKIYVELVGENKFKVTNKSEEILLSRDENYFIYFKNANFKNGFIEGRYLGEASAGLIDDYCQKVFFNEENGYWVDSKGRRVRTARMVCVENNTGATIVISAE